MLPSPNRKRVGVHESLSRLAQDSLTLRPAGSLSRPRRPLSRGSSPPSHPDEPLVSFQTYRHLSSVESSSTGSTRPQGALRFPDDRLALTPARLPLAGGGPKGRMRGDASHELFTRKPYHSRSVRTEPRRDGSGSRRRSIGETPRCAIPPIGASRTGAFARIAIGRRARP